MEARSHSPFRDNSTHPHVLFIEIAVHQSNAPGGCSGTICAHTETVHQPQSRVYPRISTLEGRARCYQGVAVTLQWIRGTIKGQFFDLSFVCSPFLLFPLPLKNVNAWLKQCRSLRVKSQQAIDNPALLNKTVQNMARKGNDRLSLV